MLDGSSGSTGGEPLYRAAVNWSSKRLPDLPNARRFRLKEVVRDKVPSSWAWTTLGSRGRRPAGRTSRPNLAPSQSFWVLRWISLATNSYERAQDNITGGRGVATDPS